MPELKNRRQELFCRAYVLEPIAFKAAVKAGYGAKYADEGQRRLMRLPHIADRIAELRVPQDEAFQVTQEAVLKRLHAIATVDARDLMQYRIGPCRYCHGLGHAYQWTTKREYQVAVAAATKALGKDELPPEDDPNWPSWLVALDTGLTQCPNPDCPECAGLGRPYVTATDTRLLSEGAAMLFIGAKQGAHGIEIALQDRARALEMLAKHFGVGKQEVVVDTSDRLSAGLVEILGRLDAAAPIRLLYST